MSKIFFLLVGVLTWANRPAAGAEPARSVPPIKNAATAQGQQTPEVKAFAERLSKALTAHLSLLLGPDGKVKDLKGKTGEGQGAYAFYLAYELTHEEKYRRAALALVDQVLQEMRATRFGVLAIKEKEKPGGKTIVGGGPPPFGHYSAALGYILNREGGRAEDLRYVAECVDKYPWSDAGWWAADMDVTTGEPKQPLTKPSIINKNATMAMAAGALSRYVREIAPELSASLERKTKKCLYERILPGQEEDGFWHYSMSKNDPKDKDILGYFMLTTDTLMQLQFFNPAYREPKLEAALQKAQLFALQCLAPMTDPNTGPACDRHRTPSTPPHYSAKEDAKRSFSLGLILMGGGHYAEGMKILGTAIQFFPFGDLGQDGAHSAAPSALVLRWLQEDRLSAK